MRVSSSGEHLYSLGAEVENALIDCRGFEKLGVPSPLECWKHQAHLLASEIGDLKRDLDNARRNIRTLVKMHTEVSKDRDALVLEVARLKWASGEAFRESTGGA